MKKVFMLFMALCALTMAANAVNRNYLCGITSIKVDTLQSSSKNQFTVTFEQKCKNTAEYGKPTTYYTSTVKLVLNSDDRTLEGVYTTEGASTTSSSANVNDQTINLITSEFTSGSTSRVLRSDVVSTFTIEKIGEKQYQISDGTLYFTQRVNKTDNWTYYYSYDAEEILTEGISKKPYVFGYSSEYQAAVYNYDMTVNGISVVRDDSDYDAIRYFLTLSCVGKNREDNTERNYEVQLAIYPSSESIVGTFATQGGNLLYSSNSYVKDLKINKTRYLANDSLSTIQIKSKGTNQYSFYGGTLTCTDVDLNYQAVYGKKRVEAVHYYHFSDNEGAGIPFGYDETSKEVELTASKISVASVLDGWQITVTAADANSVSYSLLMEIESESIDGTFTYNNGLSAWSKVERGQSSSYVASGATLTINKKSNGNYTISGNLLCENEMTYILKPFDFSYTATGIEAISDQPSGVSKKVLLDGQIYLIYEGQMYDVQGKEVR